MSKRTARSAQQPPAPPAAPGAEERCLQALLLGDGVEDSELSHLLLEASSSMKDPAVQAPFPSPSPST